MEEKDVIFKFDKFIKDIQKREADHSEVVIDQQARQDELPQRKHNERYREHWQNSTRYRR